MLVGAALAAGAAGLAGYGLAKRKERRRMANGYVSFNGHSPSSAEYANIHYGRTGQNHQHHGSRHHRSSHRNNTTHFTTVVS